METSMNYTLKTLAEEDRPREKLIAKGRQSLSNAELLAILIGSGNAHETAVELSTRILSHFQNDLHSLGKLQVADLTAFHGVGTAKAVSIIAALELGRRRNLSEAALKVIVRSSKDIFDHIQPLLGDLQHEEFWVIYLNKGNRIIDKERISSGGVAGTVVDVKIILKNALQKLASGIILAHNHPSGNLQPSDADISVTKKLKEAAKLMEMHILDHIIVGEADYYSFADNGII
jgi:DNA repair protein RadC